MKKHTNAAPESIIETTFITHLINSHKPVFVFLKNSIRLKGLLVTDTPYSVFIKDDSGVQLVYKNMISTISPQEHF